MGEKFILLGHFWGTNWNPHHLRNTGAINICIHQSHLCAGHRQGNGKVGTDGRFTHPALSTCYSNDIFDSGKNRLTMLGRTNHCCHIDINTIHSIYGLNLGLTFRLQLLFNGTGRRCQFNIKFDLASIELHIFNKSKTDDIFMKVRVLNCF